MKNEQLVLPCRASVLAAACLACGNAIAAESSVKALDASAFNSGVTTNIRFDLQRTGDLSDGITVRFTTADGTAKAGVDYQAVQGLIAMPAGTSTASIYSGVYGEPPQADKQFELQLLGAAEDIGGASFGAPQSFPAGPQTLTGASADFNGDGLVDLAVTDQTSGPGARFPSSTVAVLLNQAAGAPAFAAPQYVIGGTAKLPAIATADFNGDGRPDIVAVNSWVPGAWLLINTTTPGSSTVSFASQSDVGPLGPGTGVAISDLNGDGRPDLVFTSPSASSMRMYLNTTSPGAATATFTMQDVAIGIDANDVAAGDLDGDGRPDLVIARMNGATVDTLRNLTPPGAATAAFGPVQSFAVGGRAFEVAVGDVNGDGRPDLVAGTDQYAAAVMLNTTPAGAASFTFAAPQLFTTGLNSVPRSVGLVDLNGDGAPEIVSADGTSGGVSVLPNQTARGGAEPIFDTYRIYATDIASANTTSAIVGDYDGDGRPDVAATDAQGLVTVLGNQLDLVRVASAPAVGTIRYDGGASLSAPTNLVATRSGPGQVTLSWTAVAGAQSYLVFGGNSPGKEKKKPLGEIRATSITLSIKGGRQYFTVAAKNGVVGPMSNEASVDQH